jgi:hypothetical protein
MIRARAVAFLLTGVGVVSAWGAERDHARAAGRTPFLEQRLHSVRWEVRYYLAGQLDGRDGSTKRAFETLIRDKHQGVANQALVRYLNSFVAVDKALFEPRAYVPGRFPVTDLPEAEPNRALVDYCLGWRVITPKGGFRVDDMQPTLGVLDPKKRDDPTMYESLTIVGMLGQQDDAPFLYPFLESTNDYVVVGAAKALLRLGDKTKALRALVRLTEGDPKTRLYYITEALHVLQEVEHPGYRDIVLRVLATIDKTESIQPNWLNAFLFLASDVSEDVWK